MLKRIDAKRDIITIIYLITVFAAIGLFFGKGSLTSFINNLQLAFPLADGIAKVKELLLAGLAEGTLGETKNGELYETVVKTYFKESIPVIVSAFALSIPLGMAKGIFDFRKKNGPLAPLGNSLTSFITSLPDFFLIIVLQWVIIINFRFIDWFGSDEWYSFIIPSVLVSIYPLMYFARITSAALFNEEGQMYIQAARATGLTEKLVVKKHILKKCLVSILQHFPAVMTYILSNLLMVEWLVDYKGAAWRFLVAITRMQNPNWNEAGLAIEFSLCFMLILFLAQVFSTFWQHKYQVEKSNLLLQLVKILIRYVFISSLICLIFSFIKLV